MKVKIIHKDNVWDLEKTINKLLSEVDSADIIDIKYQGVGNSPAYSTDRPSAMIIMSDDSYGKIRRWF